MHFISRTSAKTSYETGVDGIREQLFTHTHDGTELPGVLWTPTSAPGDAPHKGGRQRPLILICHGGGQHKKAPEVMTLAHRLVRDLGAAVASVDVPGHGDRPTHREFDRLSGEMDERLGNGEDRATLIAGFQAHVARQTVPEWRSVLDALQSLDQVGDGPVGYWGVSLGCGLGVPFVAAEPRVQAAVLGLGTSLASADDAARITVPVEFLMQWDDQYVSRERALALFDALASPQKIPACQSRRARRDPRLRTGPEHRVLRASPHLIRSGRP